MIEYTNSLGQLSNKRVIETRTRYWNPRELETGDFLYGRIKKGFLGAKTIINLTQGILDTTGRVHDSFLLITLPITPKLDLGWWIRLKNEKEEFSSKMKYTGESLDRLSQKRIYDWHKQGVKLHLETLSKLNLIYINNEKIDLPNFFDFL